MWKKCVGVLNLFELLTYRYYLLLKEQEVKTI